MPTGEEAKFYLETLKTLVSQPTAPFHEGRVARVITNFLKEIFVPYEVDQWGNIMAHYNKEPQTRPLALMAHMDHPAFELVSPVQTPEFKTANWLARLMGGVSARCFENPSQIKVFSQGTPDPGYGRIVGYRIGEEGPRDLLLFLEVAEPEKIQPGDFGIWDLPDFELKDGFIHARVMDDLIGCAATLLTLCNLSCQDAPANVYGIFTRAEEVGLVGAELIFRNNALPKDCFVVSLEASKALPGALQGEGPVIRVGDRGFTFSETAEFILKQAAAKMNLKAAENRQPPVKIQRQLMSGGGCEAGAAIKNGYLATGLAFPLGNYHNVGADFTLQAENIHQNDFLTGVDLLTETALLMPQYSTFEEAQVESGELLAKYSVRLQESASNF